MSRRLHAVSSAPTPRHTPEEPRWADGHDTHFLRRLDRLSDEHVELALELYRDPDIVRELVAGERSATGRYVLSFGETDGPFIVVTHAARFVTCLGRGMSPHHEGQPLVPRAALDAVLSRRRGMRARAIETRVVRAAGGDREAERLTVRMAQLGLRFAREDAAELLAVRAVYAEPVVNGLRDLAATIETLLPLAASVRFDRMRGADLAVVWQLHVCAAMLSAMLLLTDDVEAQVLASRMPGADPIVHAAALAYRLGTFAGGYRALWAIARRGRAAIAPLAALASHPCPEVRAFRELGLGAIASASRSDRDEALAATSRLPALAGSLDERMARLGAFVRSIHDGTSEHDHAEWFRRFARRAAAAVIHGRMDVGLAEAGAIPLETACSLVASLGRSVLPEPDRARMHAVALPWLARAEATDLFVPRDHARFACGGDMASASAWVEPCVRALYGSRAETRVAEAKVGRNDRCPCGSGGKYKRCCAIRAAA